MDETRTRDLLRDRFKYTATVFSQLQCKDKAIFRISKISERFVEKISRFYGCTNIENWTLP